MGTLGHQTAVAASRGPEESRPQEPPSGPMAPGPYSLAERDRRFANVRRLLQDNDLDALLIPRRGGETILEHGKYLTNAPAFLKPSIVVFPVDGDAFVLNPMPIPGDKWIPKSYSNFEGRTGELAVKHLKEEGLADKKFGVVGLEPGQFGLPEFYHDGLWDYSVWSDIETGLADARFVDITGQY